jgi:hypothetical protein
MLFGGRSVLSTGSSGLIGRVPVVLEKMGQTFVMRGVTRGMEELRQMRMLLWRGWWYSFVFRRL